jgi:hypothetical protein
VQHGRVAIFQSQTSCNVRFQPDEKAVDVQYSTDIVLRQADSVRRTNGLIERRNTILSVQ